MMDFNTALVFTVGSIVGSILITQLWQMNYFKRENFKFGQQMKRKEYSINFKKLERDLGIAQGKELTAPAGLTDNLIQKGMDLYLSRRSEDEDLDEPDEDIIHTIVKEIGKSPEAKKVIGKFLGGDKEGPQVTR